MITLCTCALWLSLHAVSWHSNSAYDYNNATYGAGLSMDVSPTLRAYAGAYENSYNENSIYAGAAWLPFGGDRLKFGGVLAYASNYKQYVGVNMIGGIAAEWTVRDNIRLLVVGVPPDAQNGTSAVSFVLQLRLR